MDERIINSQEQTPVSQNTNSDMEAEYVTLRSQGIYYKGKFKGLDKLLVRKLNWTDEDILTTKSFYENGTLYDVLLKRVIVDDCGFNPLDLIPIDREAILWWLRIGAFGREYTVPYKCKNRDEDGKTCGHTINVTWDLGDFEMPDLPEQYENELRETGGIKITLPNSELTCKISVPSIGKIKTLDKAYNTKKTKEKILHDFNNTVRLLSVIEEAYEKDGKVLKDGKDIYQWLMRGQNNKPLPMLDTRYIIKKATEIALKVNTKKDIICPDCNHVEEGVDMPMSIYFFYPTFDEMMSF